MSGWESMDYSAGSAVTEVPDADCAPSAAGSGNYSKLQSYLKIATKCMEKVQGLTSPRGSTNSLKFNKEQCEYLADKLKLTVQSASLFFQAICLPSDLSFEAMVRCVDTFKLLVAQAKETESFIQGCCKDAWIQAAMTLTNVPEHISSICFNLELCRIVLSDNELGASRSRTWTELLDKFEKIDNVEVDIVQEKASRDLEAVRRKVVSELKSLKGKARKLALCLLERLERLRSTSSSFSWSPFERFFDKVKEREQIGKGAAATVHKVLWLGMKVAMKVFHGSNNAYFEQEVSALPGVSHANVMSLFYCTTSKRACSIFMELMDKDLTSLMRDRLRKNPDLDVPFSNLVAVDIILQLAGGMLYLHLKDIVHRDLKADNVLVKVTNMENGYVHAKLADFGLSKTKENSCTNQTFNTGTSRYMAPEVINFHEAESKSNVPASVKARKYPKKSDVFSFGMVCFEILTGEIPYSDISDPNEAKRKIMSGDCPPLPDHCPPILKTLIESCWKFDPKDRPDFAEICKVLKCVKYLLMTREQESNGPVLLPPVLEDSEPIPEAQFQVKEINAKLGEAVDHRQHYDLVEQMWYLFVRVVRARDLRAEDENGIVDPYVRIVVQGVKADSKIVKAESKIVRRDNNPTWNEVFAIGSDTIMGDASLTLSVWNADESSVDDFVGGFMIDLIKVPARKPPEPRAPLQWYSLLKAASGRTRVRGDLQLAMWWGTQADDDFLEAWQSDCGGATQFRSKVFFSPKLWYLRVNVIEVQDLATFDNHLSELSVRIAVGPYQSLRTGQASVGGSGDAYWNEELMFVVAEPFDDMMHLIVVNPEDEVLGHMQVPLSIINRRFDGSLVASRWYSVERIGGEGVAFGRIHLRLCFEDAYHVMDELPDYISDTRSTARRFWRPRVGVLGLGILKANNLLPMKTTRDGTGRTDAYCVAKYGPMWIRTRTIFNSFDPRWNEQCTWGVYDPCTVLTICVYNNRAVSPGISGIPIAEKDLPIGRVQIRLSTLENNRVYTMAYPLLETTRQGVKKMGELLLAVRFSYASRVNLMQVNLHRPRLPRMHHLYPLDPCLVEDLRVKAMNIVALQLMRSESPLRHEVIRFMLDKDPWMEVELLRWQLQQIESRGIHSMYIFYST